MYPQKKTSKAFTTIYFVKHSKQMWWLCVPAERLRQEDCCELGAGWGGELVRARVVFLFTGGLPNNRRGLWRAQGLGPLWLSSRSLNPNFLQLGMLLPFSLTCQLRRLTATRDRTWPCAIPRGGVPGAFRAAAQGVPATSANPTAPRCPRWGAWRRVPPPGRGAPHSPLP